MKGRPAQVQTFVLVKEAQLRGLGFNFLGAAFHSLVARGRVLHPQYGWVIACSQWRCQWGTAKGECQR